VDGAEGLPNKAVIKTGTGTLVFTAATPSTARRTVTPISGSISNFAFTDTQLNTLNSYAVGTRYVIYYSSLPVTTNSVA
jgi:hypothetical protein